MTINAANQADDLRLIMIVQRLCNALCPYSYKDGRPAEKGLQILTMCFETDSRLGATSFNGQRKPLVLAKSRNQSSACCSSKLSVNRSKGLDGQLQAL
jgi:hypothetical protein